MIDCEKTILVIDPEETVPLWHWRGTSEGHEWGQQSNTIASQVQVHPSANTNTPTRTHKSTLSQNALLWSYETRSSKDEYSTGSNNHLRSTDLFRFLNRSKNLDDTTPSSHLATPLFDMSRSLEIVWMSSESYSSSFILLSFCVFISISMLHLNKVLINGVHVTNICCISKCATL